MQKRKDGRMRTSQRAVRKYMKKSYDRLEIIVPKGQKTTIQAYAAAHGLSINALVGRGILRMMEIDAWPDVLPEAGEDEPAADR